MRILGGMKVALIIGAVLLLVAFLISVYVSRPAVHEIQAPDDKVQVDLSQ